MSTTVAPTKGETLPSGVSRLGIKKPQAVWPEKFFLQNYAYAHKIWFMDELSAKPRNPSKAPGARALNDSLTPDERSASARKAVNARWAKASAKNRKAWGTKLKEASARARARRQIEKGAAA